MSCSIDTGFVENTNTCMSIVFFGAVVVMACSGLRFYMGECSPNIVNGVEVDDV